MKPDGRRVRPIHWLASEESTDAERMRVRHAGRAAQRLAELRRARDLEAIREAHDRAVAFLAAATGLDVGEVRELLKAGRTPEDLLSLETKPRR